MHPKLGLNFRGKGISLTIVASLLVISLVAMGCPLPSEVAEATPAERKEQRSVILNILHTNDLHGRIEPYFLLEDGRVLGGMARIATVVNNIRQMEENVILVDAGDTIHGTGLSDLYEGKSMISVMNAIGYDVMVAGNHDFHWRGAEVVLARSKEATFPIISANIIWRDKRTPLLPPFVIIERGGLRVGFLGLTTTGTPGTVGHGLVADLEFLSPLQTAQLYVPYLEREADIVVVLSHLERAIEDRIAKEVPGIDVIVHGHFHTLRPRVVNDTLIVAVGCWGFLLGHLRLAVDVDTGEIVDYEKRLIPITTDIKENPEITSLIQSYRRPIANYLDEVVGYTATDLIWGGWGDWVAARQPTNLGYLVADVMRNVGGAEIGLKAPWWIRDNIAAGPVRMSDIHNVLPFDWHKIIVARLKGEVIKAVLEVPWTFQAAGLTYEVDRKRPAGEQVTKVLIDGRPLEMEQTYIVAMSTDQWEHGLRAGRIKKEDLLNDTGVRVRDAVANYFREVRPVNRGITVVEEPPKPWIER
jgi:2',3'-cyclic-nucleotide 2'-phosphodiesterase (5'-nucleotidase family)